MTPSLGRIVHYRAADASERHNGTDIHPAVITRVWSDTCVNLKVLPDCGAVFDVSSVNVEAEGEQPAPRRWFWPPRV